MKNLLLCLSALVVTMSLHAQKIEVGISAGASYGRFNTNPYSMSEQVTAKLTKITPAFFAKCGYNLNNWQLQLSAGRQKLNASYTGVAYGCFGTYPVNVNQDFRFSHLSLSLNRKIDLKSIKIYAGISGGYVDLLTAEVVPGPDIAPVTSHVHGLSAGIQAGVLKPLSKHWSINAEIDSRVLKFRDKMPVNSFPISATMGIVYGI